MADGDLQGVLGDNVRALRVRRGLSQEAFGHEVGLHRTYVGGIERGERNLTLQTVERLGEVLGVSPVALLVDWDHEVVPENPHTFEDDVIVLRAASDGADPGPGARMIAQQSRRKQPPKK